MNFSEFEDGTKINEVVIIDRMADESLSPEDSRRAIHYFTFQMRSLEPNSRDLYTGLFNALISSENLKIQKKFTEAVVDTHKLTEMNFQNTKEAQIASEQREQRMSKINSSIRFAAWVSASAVVFQFLLALWNTKHVQEVSVGLEESGPVHVIVDK